MSKNADFCDCPRCGAKNPRRPYWTHCVGCGTSLDGLVRRSESRSRWSEKSDAGGSRGGTQRRLGNLRAAWSSMRAVGVIPLLSSLTALGILAHLLLIHATAGPEWMFVCALFAPRAVWLAPSLACAAVSAWKRRWAWGATSLTLVAVVLGPLMGGTVPWRRLVDTRPTLGHEATMHVMTLNLGLDGVDTSKLTRLIEREHIDILLFQEGPPEGELLGYLKSRMHVASNGLVASRMPIESESPPLADNSTTERRYTGHLTRVRLKLPEGGTLAAASVHLPTLRQGFKALARGEAGVLTRHALWWESELDRVVETLREDAATPLIWGGDFNMPAEHPLLAGAAELWPNGFDQAGWGFGYTRPSDWPFARIDHILADPRYRFRSCRVGPDVGSDHLPVIAELEWVGR